MYHPHWWSVFTLHKEKDSPQPSPIIKTDLDHGSNWEEHFSRPIGGPHFIGYNSAFLLFRIGMDLDLLMYHSCMLALVGLLLEDL